MPRLVSFRGLIQNFRSKQQKNNFKFKYIFRGVKNNGSGNMIEECYSYDFFRIKLPLAV